MRMPKKRSFQPPLIHDVRGEHVTVLLHQLSSPELLEGELEQEKINSIAMNWIMVPILLCPEDRETGPNGEQIYYPYDGNRRVKALWWLHENGYTYEDIPVAELQIPAIYREDLTPATARRLAFKVNNERSNNPVTDVAAVKDAAERLGVSPFTKEGRKQIAKDLHTTAGKIGRLSKGLLIDEIAFEAFKDGRVSEQALNAIFALNDEDAKKEIAEKLRLGEEISASEVNAYRQAFVQSTLENAIASRPQIDFGGNNIEMALNLLRECMEGTDNTSDPWLKIDQAIALLEELV
jgi:ParB-like chromosome segregation protein Spo0J